MAKLSLTSCRVHKYTLECGRTACVGDLVIVETLIAPVIFLQADSTGHFTYADLGSGATGHAGQKFIRDILSGTVHAAQSRLFHFLLSNNNANLTDKEALEECRRQGASVCFEWHRSGGRRTKVYWVQLPGRRPIPLSRYKQELRDKQQ